MSLKSAWSSLHSSRTARSETVSKNKAGKKIEPTDPSPKVTHLLKWLGDEVLDKYDPTPLLKSPWENRSPANESKPTVHIAFPDDRHRIEEKRKRTYETFKSIMKKSPFNGEMGRA